MLDNLENLQKDNNHHESKKSIYFPIILLLTAVFVFPIIASATEAVEEAFKGLEKFNAEVDLPAGEEGELRDVIVNILNVLLGFLALVFIVLIFYGAFKYMTAGGNADQTSQALKILRNAVIGIAIILLSYAIVNYVFIIFIEEIL